MFMPPESLAVCSLGCTRRHLARNRGVGSYMPALGSRCRCWSYTLALGSKHRCWVVYAGIAYASWRLFRVRGGCQRWVVLISYFPCVPASTFCGRPHPSTTTRGGAMFKVGWAAHIRRGCPGQRFGRFGIRGGFRGFWRPFAFVWWYSRRWGCVQAVFTVLGGAH